MKDADKAALAKVRTGWVRARTEVAAARDALQVQIAELENPDTWECREAGRVRAALHTAANGLRNRMAEADDMIAIIDVKLRSAA